MALTLVTTLGGTTSNSYVTEAEADAYFEAYTHFSATWLALTQQVKYARLISAARSLDRFRFVGWKADPEQAMAFPRVRQSYSSELVALGIDSVGQEIPEEIKRAQMQMVMYLHFNASSTTGAVAREISSVDVDGVVAVQFDQKNTSAEAVSHGSLQAVKDECGDWLMGANTFAITK